MTKNQLSGGIRMGLAMAMASAPIWSAPIKNVLHFTKVGYFEHVGGIKGCTTALNTLASQYNFTVKTSKDFNDLANVKNYDLVIFDNNTDAGGVTNTENTAQIALKEYMNNGGKFLGIHAASDHRGQWSWYEQNIFSGIKFINHGDGQFSVYKDTSAQTRGNDTLQNMFKYAKDSLGLNTDVINFNTEIYHFSGNVYDKPGVTVFQELRGQTAQNKVSESFGWVKSMPTGGGRIVYTGLGHETAEWTANNSWQTKMLYVYMKYLMGDFDPKAVSVAPPQIQTDGHSLRILSPEARRVQILDVTGRVVAAGNAADFSRQLPKSGVYFVKVDAAHGKVFSKAVTIQ